MSPSDCPCHIDAVSAMPLTLEDACTFDAANYSLYYSVNYYVFSDYVFFEEVYRLNFDQPTCHFHSHCLAGALHYFLEYFVHEVEGFGVVTADLGCT